LFLLLLLLLATDLQQLLFFFLLFAESPLELPVLDLLLQVILCKQVHHLLLDFLRGLFSHRLPSLNLHSVQIGDQMVAGIDLLLVGIRSVLHPLFPLLNYPLPAFFFINKLLLPLDNPLFVVDFILLKFIL
jgi:hypothetical protein